MKYSCLLSPLLPEDELQTPIRGSRPNSYRTPSQLPVQDQGSESTCVPRTLMELLHYWGRLRNRKPQVTVDEIYSCRQDLSAEGMTAKEALNFLKEKNEIQLYGRLTTVDLLYSSILVNGPSLLVLPVYNDSTQFWKGGSSLLGYHAVACVGWDTRDLIIKNTWGTSYGRAGFANLPISDSNLIKEIWTIIN